MPVAAGVKKIVFAGSGGTLYGTPEKIPTKESAAQHPESPYGVAKKAVGDYLYYYRTQHGLEYTVLALANVYGPRQNPHGEAGVVAIFSNKFLDRERPLIFGDGAQTRDFVYVDDVVDAFVRAAEKGGGLTMNIGTSIETSVQQLYDVMAKLTGLPRAARLQARPHRRVAAQRDRPGQGRDPPRVEAVHDARGGPCPHARALQGPAHRRELSPRAPRGVSAKRRISSSGTGGRARPTYAGIGPADEHERVRQPFGRERERVAGLFGAEDRRRDPARREARDRSR